LEFIDFQKAFDKVWRSALMYKLLNIGVGGRFYNILKSMYTDNVSAVKLNVEHTEYFNCPLGVHQGDGLRPTLFNLTSTSPIVMLSKSIFANCCRSYFCE
jgi:hypothetical protein